MSSGGGSQANTRPSGTAGWAHPPPVNEVHPHLLQAPVSLDLGPNGPQGQAFGSLATEGPAELGAARASLPDPHLTSSLPCASVSVHLGAACGAAPAAVRSHHAACSGCCALAAYGPRWGAIY